MLLREDRQKGEENGHRIPAPGQRKADWGREYLCFGGSAHQASMLTRTPPAWAIPRLRGRSRGMAQAGKRCCHSQQRAARRRDKGKRGSRQCSPERGEALCERQLGTKAR